jgi:hypothetical protein
MLAFAGRQKLNPQAVDVPALLNGMGGSAQADDLAALFASKPVWQYRSRVYALRAPAAF